MGCRVIEQTSRGILFIGRLCGRCSLSLSTFVWYRALSQNYFGIVKCRVVCLDGIWSAFSRVFDILLFGSFVVRACGWEGLVHTRVRFRLRRQGHVVLALMCGKTWIRKAAINSSLIKSPRYHW